MMKPLYPNMPKTSRTERMRISLPRSVLEEIDRLAKNRSRFVLEAVRRELDRRKRQGLLRSMATPHSESRDLADWSFDDWADRLPAEDPAGLVDSSAGTSVQWKPGEGWRETTN
jgi:hypothetical protein